MKTVYGVRWIEVEFGQRPEGWKLYLDKDECAKDTQRGSKDGAYPGGGGYLGPERPLRMYEIPFDSLPEDVQERLGDSGSTWTENRWEPKFRDHGTSIPY